MIIPHSRIEIRVSASERHLLEDFAAAHGVSIETLVREALTFPPVVEPAGRRLQVCNSAAPAGGSAPDRGSWR